jgi:peroxiredoxin
MSVTRFVKNPFVFIPLTVGVLLPCAALLTLHFTRKANSEPRVSIKDAVVISGLALPKTDLLDLEGNPIAPDTLRKGKVMMIFMTTSCEPCRKQMALVSAVEPEISGKVKIYGVGIENRTRLNNFLKENNIRTSILMDEDGSLMKALSVTVFPTRFLIQDGVILNTWFGNSASKAQLFQELGL